MQTVFPESLLPDESNFKGTKRLKLVSCDGQDQNKTEKGPPARILNKKDTNVGETVKVVSSVKSVSEAPLITTVVPFQLKSDTASADTVEDTVATDEELSSPDL